MSCENGITNVRAVIRASARARSPSACRETSNARHFRHMHTRLPGVHRRDVVLEQAAHEILDRGEAGLAPGSPSEELRARARSPPRRARAGAGRPRRSGRPESPPRRSGATRALYARGAGRSRDRRQALDHRRIAHGPLVGLLRTHGEADDECEPVDPEHLGHEPVLGRDVVRRSSRRGNGAPTGRVLLGDDEKPLPSWPGADDEVPLRIERAAGRDRRTRASSACPSTCAGTGSRCPAPRSASRGSCRGAGRPRAPLRSRGGGHRARAIGMRALRLLVVVASSSAGYSPCQSCMWERTCGGSASAG